MIIRLSLLLISLFLVSCGGKVSPKDLVKDLRSDSKLAFTIKNFQTTTCKENCLVGKEYWEENCWKDLVTEEIRCVDECPLAYLQFICIDLQKEVDDERRKYVIAPDEWQKDVAHLFGYYAHSQIRNHLSQPLFLCDQDLALCENHFEPIQALQRFIFEYEETNKEGE